MLAIEECLRKRTALKPLEEALIIGVDARAHPWLALAADLCILIATSRERLKESARLLATVPTAKNFCYVPSSCAAGVH